MPAEQSQPDVDDGRWEIDTGRHVVGMDCSVTRLDEDGNVAGEEPGKIEAVWLFPGLARTRRRRARRRQHRQLREGPRQLRQVLSAMNLYKARPESDVARRIEPTKQATSVEPSPNRAGPAKSFARVGARTGFYRGRRNKRLALSSYAIRRGVLGRRVGRDTTKMRERTQHSRPSSRVRQDRGTTFTAVEEESPRRSTPQKERHRPRAANRNTGAVWERRAGAVVGRGAFNTTTNWYHSVTIPSIHPIGTDGSGTSVVPLLSSGGVAA